MGLDFTNASMTIASTTSGVAFSCDESPNAVPAKGGSPKSLITEWIGDEISLGGLLVILIRYIQIALQKRNGLNHRILAIIRRTRVNTRTFIFLG